MVTYKLKRKKPRGGHDVVINKVPYNLEELRQRAVLFFPNLLQKYFVKCIETRDGRKFTYDWDGFLRSKGKVNPSLPKWFFNMNQYEFDDVIRPVPGLSTDTHTDEGGVDKIYRAVKKAFVMATEEKVNSKGIYQAHIPMETIDAYKSLALTAFVGLVVMHNFCLDEAAELIGANRSEFAGHWDYFKELIDTAISPDANCPAERLARARTFYTKVHLAINCLRGSCGSYLATVLAHLH